MFYVVDWVYVKVSPMKGVMQFGKKGKLSPRYVWPYEVFEWIDKMAYRLDLPSEMDTIHIIFHTSMLRKFISDIRSIMPISPSDK